MSKVKFAAQCKLIILLYNLGLRSATNRFAWMEDVHGNVFPL